VRIVRPFQKILSAIGAADEFGRSDLRELALEDRARMVVLADDYSPVLPPLAVPRGACQVTGPAVAGKYAGIRYSAPGNGAYLLHVVRSTANTPRYSVTPTSGTGSDPLDNPTATVALQSYDTRVDLAQPVVENGTDDAALPGTLPEFRTQNDPSGFPPALYLPPNHSLKIGVLSANVAMTIHLCIQEVPV